MKKISIIVVLLIVFGIAGIYFFSSTSQNTDNTLSNTVDNNLVPMPASELQGKGSFKNLLGLGKNLKCTVSYNPQSIGMFEGTTYVSGTKMRADFTTVVGDSPMQTSMITDGTNRYMWGKTQAGDIAMKFAVDGASTQAGTNQQFDMNADVDYNCEDWRVDESVFMLPSDLDFIDMTAMQKATSDKTITGPSTGEYKDIQCGLCSQIQDKGPQDECLKAFSC